nr:MAG TPA: hypothetical protein [Caudoviricetes sp.]
MNPKRSIKVAISFTFPPPFLFYCITNLDKLQENMV